ncbi:MAG: methylthioribose-phosphate isomerase [Pseudomonadota bacterium]
MTPWTGPTLEVHADHLRTPDQTLLPFELKWLRLDSLLSCEQALREMQVRGAPLIGAVAAFGLAFGLREGKALPVACERLAATRPTAVNLRWALDEVSRALSQAKGELSRAEGELSTFASAPGSAAGSNAFSRAWQRACEIAADDARINAAIGHHGLALLRERMALRQTLGRPVAPGAPLQLLTHCNAGRLATVDHGTALAPVYAAHAAGIPVHVWVDETRPRNQGASLTAWELMQAGVPCTVVADNAGGWLMQQGRVDAVIVGCDRVAANGDVVNKIGTLLKALAAREAGLPFWVACPTPTLDFTLPEGALIPIEMRDARELTHARVRLPDGAVVQAELMDAAVSALNPAFDLTPARLVDALITEHGAVPASQAGLLGLNSRSSLSQ